MIRRFVIFATVVFCAEALCAAKIEISTDVITSLDGWGREDSFIVSEKKGGVATGKFKVGESGEYYVWVRTRNHGENWRRAELSINDKVVGEFGDQFGYKQKKPGWGWTRHRTKTVKLATGEAQLKLKALGTMCRVEKIVLSTDKAFFPGNMTTGGNNDDFKDDPGHMPIAKKLDGVFPRPRGPKNGPTVLMFGGGRPWMTNTLASKICKAGANLYLLNGVYLGGLSGTSIKITPSDPVEPKPLDYVPYEFKQLSKYKTVFISAISEQNQSKLFNADRVAALTKYVRDGGSLVLTVNTPEELFDLCPVELGDKCTIDSDTQLFATRPDGDGFSLFPEKWGTFDPYREADAKKSARILSRIVDKNGETESVYAAIWNVGKGRVLFLNNDFDRRQGSTQFFTWAYSPALVCALISEAGGFKLDAEKALAAMPTPMMPRTVESADVVIAVPDMHVEKTGSTVSVNEKTATFSDGYKVSIGSESIDIYYPCSDKPVIKDKKFPRICFPVGAAKVDDAQTAEATNVRTNNVKSTDKLSVRNVSGGDGLSITLAGPQGTEIVWEFVSGKANVDGREFAGLGERATVKSMNGKLLNAIEMEYAIDIGNRRFRRFCCYQPPRGYCEYDLSGKSDVDTRQWGFFADGQPFSWIEGTDGVMSEFVDELFPVAVRYTAKKKAGKLTALSEFRFGRVKIPQSTAIYWHMMADRKYNTSNDWIAMYQFQRHNLRMKFGVPEIPATPITGYNNTCTKAERLACLKAAKEFGYDTVIVPMCPSPLEVYDHENVLASFRTLKEMGFGAYPWHPCCHTPGESKIVREHPEWFIRDEHGKIAGYFGGHYRTADMDDKGFLSWYMQTIDKMIDSGVAACWYDMGGAASGTYNFAHDESRIGLWPQMNIYKHYYDRGGFVITEGMNPIVKDGYLFFVSKYNPPFIGREFQFIGANSATHGPDWCYMDFFRTSMYDFFLDTPLDSWPTKFESSRGELAHLQRVKNYMPAVKAALAKGMPFIRETEFGTTWSSPNGGALFCFNGVKNLKVSLSDGFFAESMTGPDGKTVRLNGKMPNSVNPETIIVIGKKK